MHKPAVPKKDPLHRFPSACSNNSCVTNAGTEGITAHYNNVALASLPANTSVFDTAHFFALFNVAQFDGRIAYFTMKYNNLFWRPITAAYQLIRYIPLLQGGRNSRVALHLVSTMLSGSSAASNICTMCAIDCTAPWLHSTSDHSALRLGVAVCIYMKQHVLRSTVQKRIMYVPVAWFISSFAHRLMSSACLSCSTLLHIIAVCVVHCLK